MLKRNFAIVLAFAWMLPGCSVALIGAVQHSMKSDAPPVAKDQRLADLGHSALSGGSYGLAEAYLTEALVANPDNPDALRDLTVVFYYTNRADRARRINAKLVMAGLAPGGLYRGNPPRPSPTELVRR